MFEQPYFEKLKAALVIYDQEESSAPRVRHADRGVVGVIRSGVELGVSTVFVHMEHYIIITMVTGEC